MSKTNSGKQIQLRMTVYNKIKKIYDETKDKPEDMTKFINQVLRIYIDKTDLMKERFPHLYLLPVVKEMGFYIMDTKVDQVAIIDTSGLDDYTQPYIVKCKLDKSTDCEHVQYALLSSALMKFIPKTISGSEEDDITDDDTGTTTATSVDDDGGDVPNSPIITMST